MARGKSKPYRAAMAGALAAAADAFVINPLAGKLGLGLSDDMVKVGAGLILPSLIRNQLARDVAQAELVIGARNIAASFLMGSNASSSGSSVGTL